jgi:hypothetical protein
VGRRHHRYNIGFRCLFKSANGSREAQSFWN